MYFCVSKLDDTHFIQSNGMLDLGILNWTLGPQVDLGAFFYFFEVMSARIGQVSLSESESDVIWIKSWS